MILIAFTVHLLTTLKFYIEQKLLGGGLFIFDGCEFENGLAATSFHIICGTLNSKIDY